MSDPTDTPELPPLAGDDYAADHAALAAVVGERNATAMLNAPGSPYSDGYAQNVARGEDPEPAHEDARRNALAELAAMFPSAGDDDAR